MAALGRLGGSVRPPDDSSPQALKSLPGSKSPGEVQLDSLEKSLTAPTCPICIPHLQVCESVTNSCSTLLGMGDVCYTAVTRTNPAAFLQLCPHLLGF